MKEDVQQRYNKFTRTLGEAVVGSSCINHRKYKWISEETTFRLRVESLFRVAA